MTSPGRYTRYGVGARAAAIKRPRSRAVPSFRSSADSSLFLMTYDVRWGARDPCSPKEETREWLAEWSVTVTFLWIKSAGCTSNEHESRRLRPESSGACPGINRAPRSFTSHFRFHSIAASDGDDFPTLSPPPPHRFTPGWEFPRSHSRPSSSRLGAFFFL